MIPWNKGKKCPEIGDRLRGKHLSLVHRTNISRGGLGKKKPGTGEWMKENSPSKRPEIAAKISKALIGIKRPYLSERNKEKPPMLGKKRPEQRKRMLNGGASYALSFNKSPSKPQVKLFNLVKNLFLGVRLNHPCMNYSIDVAIPSLKIAVEYDGFYWHQDKERDDERQCGLEKEGWKFVRYSDYVPTKEKLLRDIANT